MARERLHRTGTQKRRNTPNIDDANATPKCRGGQERRALLVNFIKDKLSIRGHPLVIEEEEGVGGNPCLL